MRRRRVLSALALGTVGVLALTGCVPQSRADAEAYRDAIADVPGVIDVELSTSTPLPFTVQASVTAVIPADEEVLDEVIEVACAQEPNADVSFTIEVREDTVEVSTRAGAECPRVERDVIGMADAVGRLGLQVGMKIDLGDRGDDGARVDVIETTDTGRAREQLAAAEIIVRRLDERMVELDADRIDLPGDDREIVAQRLADLAAVDARFLLSDVELDDDGLVLTFAIDEANDEESEAAVERMLRALPSGLWSDVDLEIIGPSAEVGDAGPAGVRLIEWIEEDLELDAVGSGGSVTVKVRDIDELEDASARIAENNPEGLRVAFTMPASGTAPSFRVDPSAELVLDPDSNPYPRWADWWRELARIGTLDTVEVSEDGFSVWMREDVYDDPERIEEVTRVAVELAEDADLHWYEVNNRRTER